MFVSVYAKLFSADARAAARPVRPPRTRRSGSTVLNHSDSSIRATVNQSSLSVSESSSHRRCFVPKMTICPRPVSRSPSSPDERRGSARLRLFKVSFLLTTDVQRKMSFLSGARSAFWRPCFLWDGASEGKHPGVSDGERPRQQSAGDSWTTGLHVTGDARTTNIHLVTG